MNYKESVNPIPETLKFARGYVLKLGFSVIPLIKREKRPAIQWLEFQKRKPTDEELKSWFSDGKYNIGIVTGKVSGGLVVVDLDSSEALQLAIDEKFPRAPQVKTGKGAHMYYRSRVEVKNFQARDDLPGIDLRGEGGYVVAPPSVHPSGTAYEWTVEPTSENGGVWPPEEIPDFVLQKTGVKEHKKAIADLSKGVLKGERNNALARLVGKWVSDGETPCNVLDRALKWNADLEEPLDVREVKQTVDSIWEVNKRKHQEQQTGKENNQRQAIQWANIAGWVDTEPPEQEYVFVDVLPKGVLAFITAIGGTGKSYFVLTLIIGSACGWDSILGVFEPKGELVIIALLAEDSEQEVRRRIFRIIKNEQGLDQDEIKQISKSLEKNLYLQCNNPQPLMKLENSNPVRTKAYNELLEKVEEIKPDLIVIDPKSMFYGLDENSNDHNTQWVNCLKPFTQWGATIIFTHHVGKAMSKENSILASRGGQALSDGCRWQMSLTPLIEKEADQFGVEEGRYIKAVNVKNSYGSVLQPFYLGRAEGGVLFKAELKDFLLRKVAEKIREIIERDNLKIKHWALPEKKEGKPIRDEINNSEEFNRRIKRKEFEEAILFGCEEGILRKSDEGYLLTN